MALASAAAWASFASAALVAVRLRSWPLRHGVRFKRLGGSAPAPGVKEDLDARSGDEDDESSETDSLLSPFTTDAVVVGVEVDGDIVGVDAVRFRSFSFLSARNSRRTDLKGSEISRPRSCELGQRLNLRRGTSDGSAASADVAWNARECPFPMIGTLEEAKLARRFRGSALESQLRRAALKEARMYVPGLSAARQLVFSWNRNAQQVCKGVGMDEKARWGYMLVDKDYQLEKLLEKTAVELGTRLERGEEPQRLRQIVEYSEIEIKLRGCLSRHRLLMHYWDVYDFNLDTITWLCAGSRGNSKGEGDSGDSSSGGPTSRNCVMQAGKLTCSLGELIDRDEPLGSLCTYSIYCNEATLAKHCQACVAETILHIRHWALVSRKMKCKSVIMFCASSLHKHLPAMAAHSEIVLFQKSFHEL